MPKKFLIARLLISSGVALVSLIAAASAAVEPAAGMVGVDWRAITEAASQGFLFN